MEKPARRRRALRVLALIGIAVAGLRRARLSPVRVEGGSMRPTLLPGALVAVSPLRGEPALGSVVVVRRPDGSEHLKRIVALPGGTVRMTSGGSLSLGQGFYGITGDNLDESTDSRHYGPVPREDIVAIARVCYWPPRAWRLLPAGPRARRE
jgi:signal peptidase I